MSTRCEITLPLVFYPHRSGPLTRGAARSLFIPLTAGARYVAKKWREDRGVAVRLVRHPRRARTFPVKIESREIRAEQNALSHLKIPLITRTRVDA